MSGDQNEEKMVDYSSYDGAYQEGELLGEDGQTVDLDELKNDDPSRTPLVAKLLFGVVFVGLGALMYWVFMRTQPPPPPPEPPPLVKLDGFYDQLLSVLEESKEKDFRPVMNCWYEIATAASKQSKVPADKIKASCPALVAEKQRYEVVCEDPDCTKTSLKICEGEKCTARPEVSYLDFLYLLMARIAQGYDTLRAYQRLHGSIVDRLRDVKKQERDLQQQNKKIPDDLKSKITAIEAEVSRSREQFKKVMSGEGVDMKDLTRVYVSIPKAALYSQTLDVVAALVPKKSEESEEAPKKKRGRKKETKEEAKAPMFGGTLIAYASWPVEALNDGGYKPLTRFFRMEDKADRVGLLQFTPASVYFWTYDVLLPETHACASRFAKGKSLSFKVSAVVFAESSEIKKESLALTPEPEVPLKECLARRLNRILYRGLPRDGGEIPLSFQIELKP